MSTTIADLNEALRYAAESGDLVRIKQFITDGADIHSRDNAPLRRAIRHQRTRAACLLVELGAPLNEYEAEFVKLAASNGDTETVTWLLSQIQHPLHPETLDSALIAAVKSHKTDCVALLLDHGADIHAENGGAWLTAAAYGDYQMLGLLARRGSDPCVKDSQALFSAVFSHSIECVRLAIAAGADLYAQGGIPLQVAINTGDAEIVEELLRAGMTLQTPDWVLSTAWQDSLETLLLLQERAPGIIADKANDIVASAANHAAPRVLHYMLKHYRIDQTVLDDGLLASVKTPCDGNIKILLSKGANPKVNDSAAFAFALTRAELGIAKRLLVAGADAKMLNDVALTSAFIARDKQFTRDLLAQGAALETINLEPFHGKHFLEDIAPKDLFMDISGKPFPPEMRQVRLQFARRIAQGVSDSPDGDSVTAVMWLADAIEAGEA